MQAKRLVLTICSVNYLAQAKTLGDSLMAHHPDYGFIIGLVDRLDQHHIPQERLPKYPMIELHTIGISDLDQLAEKYNITEFNTAVKPFFLQYLYAQYPSLEEVHYFDPDIQVFDKLSPLEEGLATHNLVLTPHILSPFPDESRPQERDLLNTGMYNLGYLGTRRSNTTDEFLAWWADRLRDHCFIDLANGMFVDQIWANFAPIYFDKVLVCKHPGLNMAYWNLHERTLSEREGRYWVNQSFPLIFFHFSGYNPTFPRQISKYQNRFDFNEKHDVASIFDQYAQHLKGNGQEDYAQFPCTYLKPAPAPRIKKYQRIRRWLTAPLRALTEWIEDFPLYH